MALGNDLLEFHGVFLSGRGRIRSENMRPAPGIPGVGVFVSDSSALVSRFFSTEADGMDGVLRHERRFLPFF